MIVRRFVFAAAALGATVAAAGVFVVAGAFAIYQALRMVLTPAGAGAVVALAAALICTGAALFCAAQVKLPFGKGRRVGWMGVPAATQNPIDRIIDLAKERPFVSAGAAVAAGLLALANPALVTAVMRAFVTPRPPRR